ncbi:M23 family metallopeptidase [Qipengyuania sp.]|uniref:M23 family metallopeptidase n=1 Tax=Qipengyuania sp. TaxID=2004515 RepID=UPI0035C7AB59
MTRMGWGDRLTTILVTATLTSAAWIVAGGSIIEKFGDGVASVRRIPQAAPDGSVSRTSPDRSVFSPDREDARPIASQAGDFIVPVVGVRPTNLSDGFSDARGGGKRLHEALDIMAPTGTGVIAAQGGTVEKIFHSDRGGKTLYIRSPDKRTITYYAHLDSYAPGLREGQAVAKGEPLGTVGASGNASPDAPHLHFAVMQTTPESGWWEPANAINPYPLLRDSGN